MRQLSGIFDYDEDSFLSFYRSIRRQMKPQEAEQGLVDGMLTPVVMNTWLYCWLHGETEMVDWDVFFDDPDHLYVSFRWLGDFRNWIWLAVFWGMCRLCFGFGKLILF